MADSLWHVQEHMIPAAHPRSYLRSVRDPATSRLQLSVKEYVPRAALHDSDNVGATIIAINGLGNSKESYEPLLDDLLLVSRSSEGKHKPWRIRRIFTLDMVNHGQSYQLNASEIGDEPCWADFARDILQLLNTFRDRITSPVFGLGQSWGCGLLLLATGMHPRAFDYVVLMEPSFVREDVAKELHRRVLETGEGLWTAFRSPGGVAAYERGATQGGMGVLPTQVANVRAHWMMRKRDWWPSREAARREYKANKWYGSFDGRVLEKVLAHELIDVRPGEVAAARLTHPETGSKPTSENPGVRLATLKAQEVYSIFRKAGPLPGEYPDKHDLSMLRFNNPLEAASQHFYNPEGTDALVAAVRLLAPALYIWGESSDVAHTTDFRESIVAMTGVGRGGSGGVKAGTVEEAWLQRVGHGPPFQSPKATAVQVAVWVGKRMDEWAEEDRARRENNTKLWPSEINPLWYERMRGKL